jgi:hypothetical protein
MGDSRQGKSEMRVCRISSGNMIVVVMEGRDVEVLRPLELVEMHQYASGAKREGTCASLSSSSQSKLPKRESYSCEEFVFVLKVCTMVCCPFHLKVHSEQC